jgi:hypothetical protein
VQLLLEKGADVNTVGGEYGTALGVAAYWGYEPIVQLLLEKGTDVNTVGGNFGTALGAAAYGSEPAIVQLLLEKGADVNIIHGEYGCALGAAGAGSQRKSYNEKPVEVIALLLNAGAELETVPVQYRDFVQEAAEKSGFARTLEAQAGEG